jgi:hypothetical protein
MRGTRVSNTRRAIFPKSVICFVMSAGIVLAITGAAKMWSSFGGVRVLAARDPIFGTQFRTLMLMVGVLEVLIALLCFFGKRQVALSCVAWFACVLAAYRLGLWQMNWQFPCHCLGNLTQSLHIPAELADKIMKVVLYYLLLGSWGSLLWLWRDKPGSPVVQIKRSPTTP